MEIDLQKETKEVNIKRRNIIIVSVVLLVLIVIAIFFLLFNNKKIEIKLSDIEKECVDLNNCDISYLANKTGKYNFSYIKYETNKKEYKVDGKKIVIIDDIKPVIKYNGNLKLDVNEGFDTSKIIITDFGNSDIPITSSKVDIDMGDFDASKEGNYEIVITVTDDAQNTTVEKLDIKVENRYISFEKYKDLLNSGKYIYNGEIKDVSPLYNFEIDNNYVISYSLEDSMHMIYLEDSKIVVKFSANDIATYYIKPKSLEVLYIEYKGYTYDNGSVLTGGQVLVETIAESVQAFTGLYIEDYMGSDSMYLAAYMIDKTTMRGKF